LGLKNMKIKIQAIMVMIVLLLSIVKADIVLNIDSVLSESYKGDTIVSVIVWWAVHNDGKDTIKNFDELWYDMSDMVDNGIGNTRIRVFQKDTVVFCDNLAIFEIPPISYKRSVLPPGGFLKGTEGGIFEIKKQKIDSLKLQIEYNSSLEKDGGKPLWRGKLLSNRVYFELNQKNKRNILQKK